MSYKYENFGRTITVREGQAGLTHQRIVGVTVKDQSVDATTFVKPEDAPAVALAILTAAGVVEDAPDPHKPQKPEEVATYWLIQGEKHKAEQAEREAEDAKVREFRESSLSAIASVFNESNADAKNWAGLSETGREGWRTRYRAARKFFEES